jgi:hypothetical protein
MTNSLVGAMLRSKIAIKSTIVMGQATFSMSRPCGFLGKCRVSGETDQTLAEDSSAGLEVNRGLDRGEPTIRPVAWHTQQTEAEDGLTTDDSRTCLTGDRLELQRLAVAYAL